MKSADELFDGSNAHLLNGGKGGSSACYPIPADLLTIGELIRTQDNRITDAPLFIVQEKIRVYGFADGFTDDYEWCSTDGDGVADAVLSARLQKKYDAGKSTGKWELIGYKDRWEFVTACFTEQGCKDFLTLDGHNHGETRIYAEGSYRNQEFRTVRDFLKSLQG